MTEWFNQRFIPRDEHQQVVDYYRKQVARLYHELCELRGLVEALTLDGVQRSRAPMAMREHGEPQRSGDRDNVIRVDFKRPR